MQGAARQLAAQVLASLGSHAPSVTLFPALAMINRDETIASSEGMQQVLGAVKAIHGSLLQEAQLLVQHLREAACLWSEQWMHILRDVQVCILQAEAASCEREPQCTASHRHSPYFVVSPVSAGQ